MLTCGAGRGKEHAINPKLWQENPYLLAAAINSATSPELLGGMSTGGASVGEPTLTMLDGSLTPSLG